MRLKLICALLTLNCCAKAALSSPLTDAAAAPTASHADAQTEPAQPARQLRPPPPGAGTPSTESPLLPPPVALGGASGSGGASSNETASLLVLASTDQAAGAPPSRGCEGSLRQVATCQQQQAGFMEDTMAGQNVTGRQAPANLLVDQPIVDPNAQLVANGSHSPRSERQFVLEMFTKFFTKARSHDDQQQKEFVRDGVILRLRELGFETSFLQKSRFDFRRKPAFSYNMISILPGRHRQTKRDRIVLVGAHWDSATKAPGVDDNGSGSTCLLEIARIISEHRCAFNHTVMLVWFDYEEQGKYGSEFFVNDYLFPLELEKYGSKFIGAYILDMILVRDKENNTQTLPLNLKTRLTDFTDEIEREKYRGDFLATWSRRTYDEPLEGAFRSAWMELGNEARTFKAMRPELPQMRLPTAEERYEWKDFFRSDHASFWFPQITSHAVRRSPNRTSTQSHSSLNAILLTDLGPWRKSYSKCYHSACDDEHLLTDGNLSFMQQVIDSLVLTLLRVGQGQCDRPPQAPVAQK